MEALTDDERDAVECNLGLVGGVVGTYARTQEDYDEMMQIGTLALINAVQTCDAEKGALSTHATGKLHAVLQRRRHETGFIRIPARLRYEDNVRGHSPDLLAAAAKVDAMKRGPLEFVDATEYVDPADALIRDEELATLRRLVRSRLTPLQAEVVSGLLAGETIKSMAERRGVTADTLKRAKAHAIEQLRKHMVDVA